MTKPLPRGRAARCTAGVMFTLTDGRPPALWVPRSGGSLPTPSGDFGRPVGGWAAICPRQTINGIPASTRGAALGGVEEEARDGQTGRRHQGRVAVPNAPSPGAHGSTRRNSCKATGRGRVTLSGRRRVRWSSCDGPVHGSGQRCETPPAYFHRPVTEWMLGLLRTTAAPAPILGCIQQT